MPKNSQNGENGHDEKDDLISGPSVELIAAIRKDIQDRSDWENKCADFYTMRNDGFARKFKPFPGAADMHFPLADSLINKFKAFYSQNLWAQELAATFTSLDKRVDQFAVGASRLFDYKLKYRSNFEDEMIIGIDQFQQNGIGPVKVMWDHDKNRLKYDAIDPLYFITPTNATYDFDNLDRCVHVQRWSLEQYKRNKKFNQDPEFIRKIRGGQSSDSAGQNQKEQLKAGREGLTWSNDKNEILIWEIYQRKSADQILIHFVCPSYTKEPVRKSQKLPFKHGEIPIVVFRNEIRDKGLFDPRGTAEIVAPFEVSLCKSWNAKLDFLAFTVPMFTSEREIPNTESMIVEPGAFFPFGVTSVPLSAPPINFDQEMNMTRIIAEYRTSMPDAGTGQQLQPSEPKTATETKVLAGLGAQTTALSNRNFRRDLGKLYRLSFSILCEYDNELQFLFRGARQVLPKEAMQELYEITPAGGPDSWNKDAQLQKATARWQMFRGDPNINQVELDKSILEMDDPELINRLIVDPQAKQHSEYSDELSLIPALLMGLPLVVEPQQDSFARARALLDYMGQAKAQGATGVTPSALHGLGQRLAGHFKHLSETPQGKSAVRAMTRELESILNDPMPAGPGNGGVPVASEESMPDATASPPANVPPAGREAAPPVAVGLPPEAARIQGGIQ